MGSTSYSDAVYVSRMAHHASTGTSYFKHDADIRSGKVSASAHESLDPGKPNKAGKRIRESFDSDAHPSSRAVAVLFDVTGSMGQVPHQFKDKLNKLMALLVKKGYLQHPHVLFGAIGDATTDRVPLQVGQFEGGNEMDEALANIFIEGGGGGQHTESYELAMYYMARHTEMDCLNKRGEKGYLFISGDEVPYDRVKKSEVKTFIGDNLESNIPLESILEELRNKFEVFWVYPKEGSYWNDKSVVDKLRKLFGQAFIPLDKAEDICEVIATTIGVNEGYDIHDISSALKDIGADVGAIDRAAKAVAKFKSTVVKTAKVDGDLVTVGTDTVDRL